ncbi:MAG: hypothetical protein J6U65_05480, partial [Bacteroidaceae bacterium]|nr:hypothetical protein [Bacteroidaceae bacterium]
IDTRHLTTDVRAVRPYMSIICPPEEISVIRVITLIVKIHGLNCILYLTQKPQINAETMRGSLYIMETFAERAHSACAPRPDSKAQASACAPLRILS